MKKKAATTSITNERASFSIVPLLGRGDINITLPRMVVCTRQTDSNEGKMDNDGGHKQSVERLILWINSETN